MLALIDSFTLKEIRAHSPEKNGERAQSSENDASLSHPPNKTTLTGALVLIPDSSHACPLRVCLSVCVHSRAQGHGASRLPGNVALIPRRHSRSTSRVPLKQVAEPHGAHPQIYAHACANVRAQRMVSLSGRAMRLQAGPCAGGGLQGLMG